MTDTIEQVLERINRKLSVLEEVVQDKDVIYVLEAREGLLEVIQQYEERIDAIKCCYTGFKETPNW